MEILLELNVVHEDPEKGRVYLADFHEHDLCMAYAWKRVMRQLIPPTEQAKQRMREHCDQWRGSVGESMCEEQQAALEIMVKPFLFINGRAGSGKSAFLRMLVEAAAMRQGSLWPEGL